MLADYAASDFVHYFSRETMVSLELSLDWAEEGEAQLTAIYAYRPVDDTYTDDDDDDEATPRFVVRLIPMPGASDSALDRLMAETVKAAPGKAKVLSRGAVTVDELPGQCAVLEHDSPAGRVVRYQAFARWDAAVFSFTGTCPNRDQKTFLPQFEAAVASARIVPMRAA